MAELGTQILQPISPTTLNEVYPTHFDEFGHGGYVAVTSNAASSVATNGELNAVVYQARRKVGMLVFDTSTEKYYRCTSVSGGWTEENFGGGTISSVQVFAEDGLSVSPATPVTSGSVEFTVGLGVDAGTNNPVKVSGGSLVAATVSSNGTAADFASGSHTQSYTTVTGLGAGAKLLGHTAAGSGAAQIVTIGQNLELDGSVLKANIPATVIGGVTPISVNQDSETGSFSITHQDSVVVAGSAGSGTSVPSITVDQKGHVTALGVFTPDFLPLAGGTLTGSLTLSGASSDLTVGGDVVITGDLQINGTQTVINTTVLQVEDLNVELGINAASDAAANGGGITLKGGNEKKIYYSHSNAAWTSNLDWNLETGKRFEIGGVMVLDNDGLGSTVTESSLTSVGVLTGGTWNANAIGLAYGGTGADLSGFAQGTIFMKGSGSALVEATAGTDYLNNNSTIDGGGY
jgi:hypothetical protein